MYGQCWDTLLVITYRQSHDKYQPQKTTTKSPNLTYSLTTVGVKKLSFYLVNKQHKKVHFLKKKSNLNILNSTILYFETYKTHFKIGI